MQSNLKKNVRKKKKMNKATKKLLEMLSYKRKEGSLGQKMFCDRFLRPVMGSPDDFENFICEVTEQGNRVNYSDSFYPKSNIIFMAHHDTVHKTDGRQKVVYLKDLQYAMVDHDECLGADCTTGVWLILEMIKAKVPGIYIIHSGEECGGIGSSGLVKSAPDWLLNVEFAISFDRMGTGSIITHQMGSRTCSESFSSDLESILSLNLKSDSGGVYTDSYEYADIVSECTNISVGYYKQHTKGEYQDVGFAIKLKDSLINAEWGKLVPYRDPSVVEYDGWYGYGKNDLNTSYGSSSYISKYDTPSPDDIEELVRAYPTMEKLIEEFPYEVSQLLSEYGIDRRALAKEIIRNSHW